MHVNLHNNVSINSVALKNVFVDCKQITKNIYKVGVYKKVVRFHKNFSMERFFTVSTT